MFLKKTSDVIIIGSGIVGNSLALALSKMKYKVRVIDKNRNVSEGTTGYSSGICRMYYTLLDSVKLSYEAYQYWNHDKWLELVGHKDPKGMMEFRECGAVFINSKNSINFLNKTCPLMKQVGVPFENLNLVETKELLKGLKLDLDNSYIPRRIDDEKFGEVEEGGIQGCIYMPKTGFVSDPSLACSNLEYGSIKNGVEYQYGTETIDILKENGKVKGIKSRNGDTYYAPIIVNCAGPYSQIVNRMAFKGVEELNDIKVNTRPLKQEVAYTNAPRGVNVDRDGIIICDNDIGVHFRPEVGNKWLIGNSEPECDPLEWLDDSELDSYDNSITDQWTNQIYRAALRCPTLPIPSSKEAQGVVSLYDVSDDWTPIYDKTNLDGYYLAIGTSGNQFKNAGSIGEIMSDLIDKIENGYNIHDFKSIKFHLRNIQVEDRSIDNTINMASFSRLREIQQTSNTVFG